MGNRINDDPSKPCLVRFEDRTLEEAEEVCAERGGRLATFETLEDAQALKDFARTQLPSISLRNTGTGWKFHGSAENSTALDPSLLEQLFGTRGLQSKQGCARFTATAPTDQDFIGGSIR